MLAKLTESTGGKIGLSAVVVVIVAFAAFIGFRSMGDQSQTADPQAVKAAAQTQLDVIKNQKNLPPELKAQMIAQYQAQAQGGAQRPSGPPKGGQ
jgi:hypothetical protein